MLDGEEEKEKKRVRVSENQLSPEGEVNKGAK